jgi:hypothetical protein
MMKDTEFYKVGLMLRSASDSCFRGHEINAFTTCLDDSGKQSAAIWVAADKRRAIASIQEAAEALGFELVEKEKPATEPHSQIFPKQHFLTFEIKQEKFTTQTEHRVPTEVIVKIK